MKRNKIAACLERCLAGIFRSGERPWDRFGWGWFLIVFLLGMIVWGTFLSWGNLDFDVHDWMPLYIGASLTETERFLAIPDTVISPQILLLRWVSPGTFVLLDALLLYSLGAFGFLLLARKLEWSPFSSSAGWVLFGLNGHITAQVAVGHSMWLSYFLLPFFLLLLLQLLEGSDGWRWILGSALLAFAVLLNGGYHFFLWMAMFQLLLAVFRADIWRPVLTGLGFSGLLGMVRLLPAAVAYWGEERAFIGGYPSIMDLFEAITVLKYPGSLDAGTRLSIGWWELDAYMGLIGLSFLLIFGLVIILRTRGRYQVLLAPAFGMLILSMGKLYQPVTMLPIPLVGAERVSSRFIIMPLVILVMLAAIGFDHWQKKHIRNVSSQAVVMALWGLMTNDILQHARLWRVENMTLLFDQTPVDIGTQILSRSFPAYEQSLLIGAVITALTLCGLILLAWREGLRAQG